MFGYEILRNKWALMVLFGGVAFMLYTLLFILDYYRERKMKESDPQEYETEYLTAWKAMPWSIKVTIAVIVVFGLVYSIHAIMYPNSW